MKKGKGHLALIGNPNSGKTSTFNQLTGSLQSVGNWPGVTVERKAARLKKQPAIMLQDLPGIYSLSPYSPEEVITRDYLVKEVPDGVINIVDGMNLERNLYLTLQVIETGLPVVLGVNMMDLVKKSGKKLNLTKLSYGLGISVVGISALKKSGLEQLVSQSLQMIKQPATNFPRYDERLEAALSEIGHCLTQVASDKRRWYALKLFERDALVSQELQLSESQQVEIAEIIAITEKIFGDESDAIVVNARYEFITQLMALCMVSPKVGQLNWSDQLDQIVTNCLLALPIFAGVMWFIYYLAIQSLGSLGTDWVNDVLFGSLVPEQLSQLFTQWQVAPWMQSLILDGLVAGVGAVLGFLPQIVVLFFCLAILEDCGYMARIAFVMDRLFRKFGMSGKSFIPMLIATGCGVPGVMASRTIENEQDRRLTVMVTTFMPCSAKLPIIALVTGAFFPTSSWVAPSAYFLGCATIIFSGIALKKTRLFAGDVAPFIMELPAYHLPQMKNVLRQTYERAKAFVKKAGSIIFLASLIIWVTSTYNFLLQPAPEEQSMLAFFGKLVAPIFAPLGWGNWQSTVATITGLIAKENVIGTFGVLFGQTTISENGAEVWGSLQQSLTPVAAYAFLTFNLLCAPCFAAIGAIHREMAQQKWTWLAIGYQCGLAYVVSFLIYQLGHVLFEDGAITGNTLVAGLLLVSLTYFVIRKPKPAKTTVVQQVVKEGARWQRFY